MSESTEERIDRTFACIDEIKKQVNEKNKLSFEAVDKIAEVCKVDVNFVFGNMSLDDSIKIDYSKSEVRKS